MRCKNCGADIPPAFVHAIANNQCAGCGGEIMSEEDKVLMNELASAMERMPNDPQGVAGWLMSNYRFQKVGEAVPTEKFHRKGGGGGGPVDTSNLKIAESPVDQFLNRTDSANKVKDTMTKVSQMKNSKMAKLAQSIQSVEKTAPDPYGFEEREAEEQETDISNEDIRAMRDMMKNGMNPFAGSESTGGMKDLREGITSEEVNAIQEYADQSTPTGDDMLPQEKMVASTDEGRRVVMTNRFKRIKAQQAIDGDGGGGAFWRS